MRASRSVWKIFLACVCAVLSVPVAAHHGSLASYDMSQPWVTDAVVTEFQYLNPHPMVFFERKNERGEIEKWASELASSPSMMARSGWSRAKALDVMKPGTPVKLTICRARAGGFSAIVVRVQNHQGDDILVGGPVGPQSATTNTAPPRN